MGGYNPGEVTHAEGKAERLHRLREAILSAVEPWEAERPMSQLPGPVQSAVDAAAEPPASCGDNGRRLGCCEIDTGRRQQHQTRRRSGCAISCACDGTTKTGRVCEGGGLLVTATKFHSQDKPKGGSIMDQYTDILEGVQKQITLLLADHIFDIVVSAIGADEPLKVTFVTTLESSTNGITEAMTTISYIKGVKVKDKSLRAMIDTRQRSLFEEVIEAGVQAAVESKP
jgi:hypothetical protein